MPIYRLSQIRKLFPNVTYRDVKNLNNNLVCYLDRVTYDWRQLRNVRFDRIDQSEYVEICQQAIDENIKALQYVSASFLRGYRVDVPTRQVSMPPFSINTIASYDYLCEYAISKDGCAIEHVQKDELGYKVSPFVDSNSDFAYQQLVEKAFKQNFRSLRFTSGFKTTMNVKSTWDMWTSAIERDSGLLEFIPRKILTTMLNLDKSVYTPKKIQKCCCSSCERKSTKYESEELAAITNLKNEPEVKTPTQKIIPLFSEDEQYMSLGDMARSRNASDMSNLTGLYSKQHLTIADAPKASVDEILSKAKVFVLSYHEEKQYPIYQHIEKIINMQEFKQDPEMFLDQWEGKLPTPNGLLKYSSSFGFVSDAALKFFNYLKRFDMLKNLKVEELKYKDENIVQFGGQPLVPVPIKKYIPLGDLGRAAAVTATAAPTHTPENDAQHFKPIFSGPVSNGVSNESTPPSQGFSICGPRISRPIRYRVTRHSKRGVSSPNGDGGVVQNDIATPLKSVPGLAIPLEVTPGTNLKDTQNYFDAAVWDT